MQVNKALLASSVVFSIISKPTYKKVNYVYNTNKKNNYKFMRKGILGLGLFWSKSTSNTSNEIQEDVNICLEKADKEFDNGHYEDCYNTLIKISK
ncbi:unnamed protein product [Parnassius apollo]|uniref:(apollo) hypothetical protein n=1 Tax=Parnassius apollo TaxID=110799 RepID=A0A8S3WT10_PARAO|nr:unnamed protein product [Parnassius apollo]